MKQKTLMRFLGSSLIGALCLVTSDVTGQMLPDLEKVIHKPYVPVSHHIPLTDTVDTKPEEGKVALRTVSSDETKKRLEADGAIRMGAFSRTCSDLGRPELPMEMTLREFDKFKSWDTEKNSHVLREATHVLREATEALAFYDKMFGPLFPQMPQRGCIACELSTKHLRRGGLTLGAG